MGKFDAGSFIGGLIVGGIAGAVFVGWNALKVGVGLYEKAGQEGWINQGELASDLKRYRSARVRAYRSRAYPARAIYGHGTGTEGDLNRIPIFLG